jgi:hypothetical protein
MSGIPDPLPHEVIRGMIKDISDTKLVELLRLTTTTDLADVTSMTTNYALISEGISRLLERKEGA